MQTHELNSNSANYVWNAIWAQDTYSSPQERLRRAERRADAFDFAQTISSGGAALDVGCGSGETAQFLEEYCSLIVGLDRSFTALDLARKRNSSSRIHYTLGEAEALPFASASFDNVLAFGVIEHVRNPSSTMSEINRVLKPGAKALISASHANSVLQINNRIIARLGRYQFGFQKNWRSVDLRSKLEEHLRIERQFIMQADFDMPMVACLDRVLACLLSDWGRYICFVVSKEDR
jgi:ubiquinone/menaquinone biosynthesis C-methylase UbiE